MIAKGIGPRLRAGLVGGIVVVAALLLALPASATNIRFYLATAASTPSPLSASTSGVVSVDLKNCSTSLAGCGITSNAGIGSAILTFPAGFTVTGATVTRTGWTVVSASGTQVRVKATSTTYRVPAGGTLTVRVTVTTPSAGGTYPVATTPYYGTDFVTYPFSLRGPAPTVTVQAPVLTTLAFDTTPPSSVQAGTGFDVRVKGLDQTGAPISGPTVGLKLVEASTANPCGQAASSTGQLGAGGTVTFTGITPPTTAGLQYVLCATSGSVSTGASSPITVTPAALASISFTTPPPASVGAGTGFGATVSGKDQYDNPVSGVGVSLALVSPPAGVVLGGTTTGTLGTAFGGLTITKAGGPYTLRATSGSATADATVSVTAGLLDSLVFVQQPTTANVGATITPAVTVRGTDQYGNPVSGSASLSLGDPGSYGGTLSGGAAAFDSTGLATFAGLSVDKFGVGYTLTATSGTKSSLSLPFSILGQSSACTNDQPENTTEFADTCTTAIAGVAGAAMTTGPTTRWTGETLYVGRIGSVNGTCLANPLAGTQSIEIGVVGGNPAVSQPLFTIALMLKKSVLQSNDLTSRSADSFDICLGAKRLDGGSGGWLSKPTTADPDGIADDAGDGYYYGIVRDCSTLTATEKLTTPCIVVKTKNEGSFNAAAGQAGIGLGFKSSDMGIVLQKPYPWDGKAGWP